MSIRRREAKDAVSFSFVAVHIRINEESYPSAMNSIT